MLVVKKIILANGKSVSFTVKKNEVIFIEGPNGSGKSLLLKSLASLLPASYEKFDFHEKDKKLWAYQDYRSRVTYSAPVPHLLLDETVEDFMKAPLSLEIYKNKNILPPIDPKKILDDWGLSKMKLSHLSTGQKQIISILRLTSLQSEVLLLDEPMSNLDRDKTTQMEEVLLLWKNITGGSLVIVSHDKDQCHRMNGQIKNFLDLVD